MRDSEGGCPRQVERNYVPLFGVTQSNVDLRNCVISRQIVIEILWYHWNAIEHTY